MIGRRFRIPALAAVLSVPVCLAAQTTRPVPAGPAQAGAPAPAESFRSPISSSSRTMLIRGLSAEKVFVRKIFPQGFRGLKLQNGQVTPGDDELRYMAANAGSAAKPGDRAQITNIEIKARSVIFEINGGPKKKKKWYQRLTIEGMGGETPLSPDTTENARGSFVELAFENFVPDLTPEQFKRLLAPVFDFTALSPVQAYSDSLPPVTRAAVKDHRVLVGMDRDMVVAAKGRPPQKIRERDEHGDYEEWIYGTPPEEVQFVKLVNDQVVQVKIMTVDGRRIVRTEREVDVPQAASAKAAAQPGSGAATPRPANAPTLRRPGEVVPEKPHSDRPAPPPNDPGTAQPPGADTPRWHDVPGDENFAPAGAGSTLLL